jgi:hypothetical protein
MEYSQLVDESEDAEWFVQSAVSSDPQLHWQEIYPGFNEFGFDADAITKLPSGERQRVTVLKNLSHPMGSTVCRDGFVGCCGVFKDKDTVWPDPTEPLNNGADATKIIAAIQVDTTFKQALRTLTSNSDGKQQFLADKELADKAVSLAGIKNVSVSSIAEAMAEVYGLQARHRTDGGITIARKTRQLVTTLSNVIPALRAVIPDSLVRCTGPHLKSLQVGVSKDLIQRLSYIYGMQGAGKDIGYVASRAIRTLAQPLVEADKSKHVALSAVGSGSRNVLAVSQSAGAFALVLEMCSYAAPAYLMDFDHATFTGQYTKTPTGAVLTFQLSVNDIKTGKKISSRGYSVISGVL